MSGSAGNQPRDTHDPPVSIVNNSRGGSRWPVRCAPGRCSTTVTPCGTQFTGLRRSPAGRSSGLMSTRATAAPTRKVVAASSPTNNAASLAPSNASCAVAPPSSPSPHLGNRRAPVSSANVVLSAVGHNFRRILAWFRELLPLLLASFSVHTQLSSSAHPEMTTAAWDHRSADDRRERTIVVGLNALSGLREQSAHLLCTPYPLHTDGGSGGAVENLVPLTSR
ncbi:hypothetical protein ACVIYL_004417 [Bradyrhizobium sp. USDA 3315]